MTPIKLAITITFIISIISCKKEPLEDNKTDMLYPEIYAGYPRNLLVKEYNTFVDAFKNPFEPGTKTDHFNIDVDDDGIDDIRFEAIFTTIDKTYVENEILRIIPLHEVGFPSFYAEDSIFLATPYSFLTTNHGVDEEKIFNNYFCRKKVPNHILQGFRYSVYLDWKLFGDPISSQSTIVTDTMTIHLPHKRELVKKETLLNNKVIYTYESYYNDCNSFPLQKDVFISFIKNPSTNPKIGWVKIRINTVVSMQIISSGVEI